MSLTYRKVADTTTINATKNTQLSPDFSPTKFFAGRDTGHEAVVIYRSLRYLQMLGNEAAADKSVGPKSELFDLKRKKTY
ncbi:MAG: hypothetical protein ACI8ZB_001856 [Desulforhopalus sp.]